MTSDLLVDLERKTERLVGMVEGQRGIVASLESQVALHETESTLLGVTSATLDNLIQMLTTESVGKIEDLVTYGLWTVVPARCLRCRFELTPKNRAPWLEPRLVDHGVEAPILDAFGGGPATVVAFVLRVVVISRMNLSPVILLDEPFTMVS